MKTYTFISLISIALLFLLIFNNCNESISNTDNQLLIGQESLIANCSACHNLPNQDKTGIAPSFYEIKNAYNAETEEEFSEKMIRFLNNPTIESAKLKDAVEQFGIMPKMSFSEQELQKITHYLYQIDLENFEKLTGEIIETQESKDYLEIGRNIALKTKSTLGKNLMKSVKEKGDFGAVEFCNEQAIPLTDSMSKLLNAKIKRVSDKPRNANNYASEYELAIISEFKTGKKLKGITKENGNKILGYYPIETNEMCMKCHGNLDTQINKKTAQKINVLYPLDKAIGYSPNQIRGMWVVEMDKK